MNHIPAAPHMPQGFRGQPQQQHQQQPPQPPPTASSRRHGEYAYSVPNHHSQPPHHVPLPQHPGPPPQPHHMPYHPYPHPQQFHHHPPHLPPPNYQQYPTQWYPPYQHYPPPHTPPARSYPPPHQQQQHHHHHQQPQGPLHHHHHSQLLQPQQQQQPPLIVSSHASASASAPAPPVPPAAHVPTPPAAPAVNRSVPPPSLPVNPPPAVNTPQQDISTPSTTSQNIASPSTTPTTASAAVSTPSVSAVKPPSSSAAPVPSPSQTTSGPAPPAKRIPYYPDLPWLSVPEEDFPPRALRRRRRRKLATEIPVEVELPSRVQQEAATIITQPSPSSPPAPDTETESVSLSITTVDATSTGQTTPSSAQPSSIAALAPQSSHAHKRSTTKPVVPAVPILPLSRAPNQASITSPQPQANETPLSPPEARSEENVSLADDATPVASPPIVVKAPPKSWAELLRNQKAAANGGSAAASVPGAMAINGSSPSASSSLADVLRLYNVGSGSKICFLEPRGLVNTGNMCYMNSILQVLVFCVPFYDFLDQVAKRMVHNFKSETPLIEAMIMFMREYPVIDSTYSVEQLRLRLKDNELEKYGDPFIPEYVYDVIKRLPRFSSMRRGQQHDAEEFLGFLFEGLHDECVHIMKGSSIDNSSISASATNTTPTPENAEPQAPADSEWMEVGPKQKAAVTRSSGSDQAESPITKIFGGKFRSVFRVPGLKDSVTLDPFQRIQLDIGDPAVSNITDALKGLARAETIHGEFRSPRGPGTPATKSFYLETLPPVLIIHLKRFLYDNAGGTTHKIWKKVGYPLDLEIPKEAFPQHQRATLSMRPGGLPKYRLISVVYHHGKSAGGGHYTVDVRRQEGREWIRIDDTIIRRVRTEDVASEGGEEDPKVLAKALEQHKREQESTGKDNTYKNIGFSGLNNEESVDGDNDDNDIRAGWSQVNGYSSSSPTTTTASGKKWANIANGDITPKSGEAASGKQTPRGGASNKFSAKDNKVAYILFYQQIHP